MNGCTLRHWKHRSSGVSPQFDYQDQTNDEVVILQVAGDWPGYKNVRLPKACMSCGDFHPREGFAPVFNGRPLGMEGETLVLLCNPCYDRRCAIEEKLEREQRELEQRGWAEKDEHRRQQNRQAGERYRARLKQEQKRKAG